MNYNSAIYIVMHSNRCMKKDGTDRMLHIYAVDPHVLSVFASYDDAVDYIEKIYVKHEGYERLAGSWKTKVKTIPGDNSMEGFGRIWIEKRILS